MIYTPIGSAIFYIIVFGSVLLLVKKGEKSDKPLLIKLGYLILVSVTVFRYDIGNDYYGMANRYLDTFLSSFKYGQNVFDIYREYDGRFEFTFILFTWLFSWVKYPYVYYVGLYGCISIFFLYKSLNRVKNCHTLGLLIYIVTGIMFNSWDWIRQSAAFMIILYSIPFIENQDYKRYGFYILLATSFHNSALLMLPIYFIKYINLSKYIIIGSLLIVIILFLSGVLTSYLANITAYLSLVNGYENYADSMQSLKQATSVFYKMRSLLYVGLYLFIMNLLPAEENVKRNLLFIGSILFLLACGSQTFQRISYYFLIISITSFPVACNFFLRKNTSRFVAIIFMIMLSFLWVRDIVTKNNRGCTPYDHVFSERFERQWFRPKNY